MKVTMSNLSALPYKTRDVSTQTAVEEKKQEVKSITISPAVKVDISTQTQTDNINTINNQEEEMRFFSEESGNIAKSIKRNSLNTLQKNLDELLTDNRRKERNDILNAKKSGQIMSGGDHIDSLSSMDQEKLPSDKSFLQKCKDYLASALGEDETIAQLELTINEVIYQIQNSDNDPNTRLGKYITTVLAANTESEISDFEQKETYKTFFAMLFCVLKDSVKFQAFLSTYERSAVLKTWIENDQELVRKLLNYAEVFLGTQTATEIVEELNGKTPNFEQRSF